MRSASGNKVVLAEVTWSSRTTHSTTITINTSTTTTTIATTVTTKAAIAKESENQRSHVGDYNDCRFRCSCPYNHSCCCHPTSPPPLSLLLLPLSTFCLCCRRRHHHRHFHRYQRHSSQATNRFFSTGIADFIGNLHLPFETWQICSIMYTSSIIWMIHTFSIIDYRSHASRNRGWLISPHVKKIYILLKISYIFKILLHPRLKVQVTRIFIGKNNS